MLEGMRSKIEAYRRTRDELREARRLEGEISSVYEAGEAMYSTGVNATEEAVGARLALGRVAPSPIHRGCQGPRLGTNRAGARPVGANGQRGIPALDLARVAPSPRNLNKDS